jgi:hypothetical protein
LKKILEKTKVFLNLREKNLEKPVRVNAVPVKKVFCVWTIYIKG